MKKLFIVLGIALLIAIVLNLPFIFPSLVKNQSPKSAQQAQSVRIESTDGLFAMEIPSGWIQSEEGTLNALSCLEAMNSSGEMYFAAIMEKKTDFDLDLTGYRDLVVSYNEGLSGSSFGDATPTQVGKYSAFSYEFDAASPDGIDMYMRLFVIETENYYGQLYSWTQKSLEAENWEALGSIGNSFVEINAALEIEK
jgi:hypothetical protein